MFSEGSSFKSTYGWCANNCDFSWKLMPPPVRKYIVFSFFSNTSKKLRKHSEAQWVMQIHVIIEEYYKEKPNDCNIHLSEVNIVIYSWFFKNDRIMTIAGKMKMTSHFIKMESKQQPGSVFKTFYHEGNEVNFANTWHNKLVCFIILFI